MFALCSERTELESLWCPVQNIIICSNRARQRAIVQAMRFNRHGAARLETEQVQASEGRRILVLLADRLLEYVDFDVGSFFSQLSGRDPFPAKGMQRIEQADRKTAGPAQSG